MIYVTKLADGSEWIEVLSVPIRIREIAASFPEIKNLNDKFSQISVSDQNAPEKTADSKSDKGDKGKQVLSENSSEFRRELFDLNEYPTDNEDVTVHDKYASGNAEASGTSRVKNKPNEKMAVEYQNSADSDYDSSRTISDLPTKSMSLNHRRYEEVVNKGTKTNDVADDITRILLPKRNKFTFNVNDDDNNNKNNNNKKKKRTAHKANELPTLNEAGPSKRKAAGVKNQRNGKKAVLYQNSADYDNSRTISNLPTESMSLSRRGYAEAVNKVHDKHASKIAEAHDSSGVKKQPKRKKAVVNQNSADYDSSRTISNLPTESMSLSHRRYEEVVYKVHDKYASEIAKAPESSRVKNQSKVKKAVVYQNSADPDYDSSRTISNNLPAESMTLHRRDAEDVNKGTKTKSVSKKRSRISFPNDVADDITRIPLPKRQKVTSNLNNDNNKNSKNKKHESPNPNEAGPSNPKASNGPSGSKTAVRRARSSKPPKHGPKRSKPSHNEIAKEVKCAGLDQCDAVGGCDPSGSDSVVGRARKVNGSGETVRARKVNQE